MAHNALIHGGVGSGAWTGIVPGPSDFELLDQRQFQSINGDLGGTWAPVAAIIIGGAGLETTGPFTATGLATINGDLAVNGEANFFDRVEFSGASFTVDAPAVFLVQSAATFTASAVFSAGLAANDPSLFTDNLTVSGGTTTFDTGATVVFKNGFSVNTGGAVGFAVAVTFASTVALQAVLTNTSEIVSSVTGRMVPRPAFSYTDSNQSIGIASGTVATNGADCVIVQTGSITTNRICTVLNANARAGTRIIFYTWDDVNTLTLQAENGAIIAKLKSGTVAANGVKAPPPAGFWNWIEIEFYSANVWNTVGGQSA